MQNANKSASERTRFLGARTLAIFHQNNPTKKEAGIPNTFASSMTSYRVAGQHLNTDCCGTPTPECIPVGTISVTSPDIFQVSWDPVPNATYYTVTTDYVGEYTINYPDNTATTATVDWDNYNVNINITVTAHNACSTSEGTTSVAPCFLAGSLVAMGDGTFKAIETVNIGDIVIGAFGELNTVLALHRPFLGNNTMCVINQEHSTTSHHPHISVDKQFYCMHPTIVDSKTYGCEHLVITEKGEERMLLKGLAQGRTKQLVEGVVLKTLNGSTPVESLSLYSMPPDTQLYNLVVGGSHTYHVDGYAVTGWPREDDFNYDTWEPKGL